MSTTLRLREDSGRLLLAGRATVSADRALRALAIDGNKILGLGDFNGSSNRDAFWFRTGSDGLFSDGFEG